MTEKELIKRAQELHKIAKDYLSKGRKFEDGQVIKLRAKPLLELFQCAKDKSLLILGKNANEWEGKFHSIKETNLLLSSETGLIIIPLSLVDTHYFEEI